MTFCRHQMWGGGSQKDFLLPLHRLDQPCSGIQMYGKTSKAASRVQSKWKEVAKLYICVLHHNNDKVLRQLQRLSSLGAPGGKDRPAWYRLGGYLQTSKRTVTLHRHSLKSEQQRSEIHWRYLKRRSKYYSPIAVMTQQGHRHMIRALLGQACPIAGDLRYGSQEALPDQSVALHSFALQLPLSLQLGSVEPGRIFQAEVPEMWEKWFGISQEAIGKELGDIARILELKLM
jgi:23S rRNA pseudouridine1911/1915/1917 synthase